MTDIDKNSRLICELPPEVYRKIKQECVMRDITISDTARRAIRDYLELDYTDAELGIKE